MHKAAVHTTLHGHRALLLGPLRPNAAPRPPLVLLGGTAQWIGSWMGHLTPLARERKVLCYETRGQAGATSTLDVADCTLQRHATDMAAVLGEAGVASSPFDVCGFSFGGRVAMAAASRRDAGGQSLLPGLRRLAITGVSADRGHRGRLALQSWRASLAAGDLAGFVWKLILDTHSSAYLQAHEAEVAGWVRAVVRANSLAGLRAIVEQTHTEDPDDRDHPLAMAVEVAASRSGSSGGAVSGGGGGDSALEAGLLVAGAEDLLSPAGTARTLADAAGWRFAELEGAAHATPIEQAVAWRRTVLGFLDE